MIQKAVIWIKEKQRSDGGWGEDNYSYYVPDIAGNADRSTSFQTAWALLALMSAGESHSKSVKNGIGYLLRNQEKNGLWNDPEFTAPGFPKVFYLKYHGYSKYFPLWALARYRNECSRRPSHARQQSMKIAILVPLQQEMSPLTREEIAIGHCINLTPQVVVCRTGIGVEKTRNAVKKLISYEIELLISWGSAAGISREVAAGDLLLPSSLVDGDKIYNTHSPFNDRIKKELSGKVSIKQQPMCYSGGLLDSVESKKQLYRNTQCVAADMESLAMAKVADELGIRFSVIRAVSDTCDMRLPRSVLKNIDTNEGINIWNFIKTALFNPRDWVLIIKLVRSFSKAQKTLNIVAPLVKDYS